MSLLRLHGRALADGPRPVAGARPAARNGAEEAIADGPLDVEAIYCERADDVARWARRLGGPEIDVEDIVHEVFLVVQRRLNEWRGDALISTWLYQITFRVVQERRRRWRWNRWSSDAVPGSRGLDHLEIAADQPDALDLLQRREATALLYRILDGIGEKYRTVIILFELEGLDGEEIAALTGTSLSNVWVRLFRARQKVMKRFLAWEKTR